uniref:Putative secreted protein n=1 Tax=Amblyomma tuberculatum TaxID=48802 RepID=A0A6M2E1G6_9ACAR
MHMLLFTVVFHNIFVSLAIGSFLLTVSLTVPTPTHFLKRYFVDGTSHLSRMCVISFWSASTAFHDNPNSRTKFTVKASRSSVASDQLTTWKPHVLIDCSCCRCLPHD